MRRNSQKGFTLIELLIVIAIIGILAAVLIPNLLGARRTAVDRAAAAYAQNVYTAVHAEMAEDLTLAGADITPTCGTAAAYLPATGSEYSVAVPSLSNVTCAVAADAQLNVNVTMTYGGGNEDFVEVGALTGAIANSATAVTDPTP